MRSIRILIIVLSISIIFTLFLRRNLLFSHGVPFHETSDFSEVLSIPVEDGLVTFSFPRFVLIKRKSGDYNTNKFLKYSDIPHALILDTSVDRLGIQYFIKLQPTLFNQSFLSEYRNSEFLHHGIDIDEFVSLNVIDIVEIDNSFDHNRLDEYYTGYVLHENRSNFRIGNIIPDVVFIYYNKELKKQGYFFRFGKKYFFLRFSIDLREEAAFRGSELNSTIVKIIDNLYFKQSI